MKKKSKDGYKVVDCFTSKREFLKEQKAMQENGLTARKKESKDENGKTRYCIESKGKAKPKGRKK